MKAHDLIAVAFSRATSPRSRSGCGDGLSFLEGRGMATGVSLDVAACRAELVWPSLPAESWDSVFMLVPIDSDGFGSPHVTIIAEALEKVGRQDVLAGETGPVWLNLSCLRSLVTVGANIRLLGHGVRFCAADALIRAFNTELNLAESLLIVAPHPDDAELAAFGLYADRDATILTVTAGNAGPPSYEALFASADEQYRAKGILRVIDSVTVPWQGGVPPDRCFNLGYFDSRLAEMHCQPERAISERFSANCDLNVYRTHNIGRLLSTAPRPSTWRNLVDDLEAVIRKRRPGVIVAPHPLLDSHSDHQFTTVAIQEAVTRCDWRGSALLYSNHADSNRYPPGPAGTIVSIPFCSKAVLDRVYSHPVSVELQRRKLFALESMHDVRFSPTRQYQLGIGSDRAIAPESVGPEPYLGILRSGPRANELFYVYDQDTLSEVVRQFLTERSCELPNISS